MHQKCPKKAQKYAYLRWTFFYQCNKINIDDIPLQLTIDGTGYYFLCVTVFVNENHFKAIFRLNGQNYLIDDFKAGFNTFL